MQVFTLGIFALQRSLKDIGAGGSLAFRDVNGSSCKHGCHVQILLEAGIGTGLAGHAVAPLDEHMALRRVAVTVSDWDASVMLYVRLVLPLSFPQLRVPPPLFST